jgi:hypothetical protein
MIGFGPGPRSIIALRSSLSRCEAVAVAADAARRESNSCPRIRRLLEAIDIVGPVQNAAFAF